MSKPHPKHKQISTWGGLASIALGTAGLFLGMPGIMAWGLIFSGMGNVSADEKPLKRPKFPLPKFLKKKPKGFTWKNHS